MVPTLRNAIIRQCVVSTIICFVASMVLTFASSGTVLGVSQLAWPIVLSLGIGAVSGWLMMKKFKKSFVTHIVIDTSYARVDRAAYPDFDWKALDEYGAQLQSRGFTSLGDFTPYPPSALTSGVAACYVNADASTLIEVQHMIVVRPSVAVPAGFSEVHFSLFSLLAGQAPVVVTDRPVSAVNYLQRGPFATLASYPGESLMTLLDKHERLLAGLRERSGKSPSNGLDMTRYIILMRERMAAALMRLQAASAFRLVREFDAYATDPKTSWSPDKQALTDLMPRSWADIDASPASGGRSPIVDTARPGSVAADTAAAGAESAVAPINRALRDALRQRIDSGANWFYWIAGLSLVNMFIAAVGSNWSFVIGLGASQVLSVIARGVAADADPSIVALALCWVLNLSLVLLYAACGWVARRPSVVAFIAGIVLYALDAVLLAVFTDWIGVLFHGVALYYLWPGMMAGREFKRLQ